MNGFMNIDKPPGMTSFDVIRVLRRQLQVKKMGHLGTLDPMATGVLPIALGSATRLISFLEATTKCYRSRGKLGFISDTQDRMGTIRPIKRDPHISQEQLIRQLQQMTGEVMQRPPMYSAVHYEGKRLYELARQGKTVDVPARPVTIYRLDLLDLGYDDQGQWADLEIECSPGTYVRTLWHDLGQALECGAYMEQLRRTRVGPFAIGEAVDLEACSLDCLLPPDYPFQDWNEVMVTGLTQTRITNGNPVSLPAVLPPGKAIIKDTMGRLLALGEITNDYILKSERVLLPASKDGGEDHPR